VTVTLAPAVVVAIAVAVAVLRALSRRSRLRLTIAIALGRGLRGRSRLLGTVAVAVVLAVTVARIMTLAGARTQVSPLDLAALLLELSVTAAVAQRGGHTEACSAERHQHRGPANQLAAFR